MSEDLEERGRRGRTRLMRACGEGDLEQVQRLIDKGANINYESIRRAAQNGHAAIVELLFRAGADINNEGQEASITTS